MPFIDMEESGGFSKTIESKVRWLDEIPFVRNKVIPKIEEHVTNGGEEPTLVALQVLGKERATIFAESHARTMLALKKELAVWVQFHLARKFGSGNIEAEHRADGPTLSHTLDQTQWPELAGWVNSSSRIRMRKKAA